MSLGLVLVLAATASACGGDDGGSDGSPETTVTADGADTTTSAASGTGSSSDATVSGAQVRIVNLFVPAEGTPGPVEVLAGYTAAEGATPVASIPFGEAGEFFEPPASSDGRSLFSIYPEGATADDDRLIQVDQTIVEGDQVTLLLTSSEDLEGSRTGSIQLYFERTGADSNGQASVVEPAPDGKALVLGNASAIGALGGDTSGFTYGVPGVGCLEDEDPSATLVGGTSTLRYPVDPGEVEVAAYAFDDNDCSADPVVGPATVELEAGSSAYVFVYGTSSTDRDLLVVPLDA